MDFRGAARPQLNNSLLNLKGMAGADDIVPRTEGIHLDAEVVAARG
jgi:hypothetical protein